MITTFILHGGFTPGNKKEDNSDFYKEIMKYSPERARVLIVPFAKDAERIPATTMRVMDEFNKNNQQKKLEFEVANEELFIKQVKSADIIYFQGGTSLKLLEVLKKYSDLKDSLRGKVVAGESAGANALGRFFYSPSANGVFKGLGILSLKIIPHYKEEYVDVFKNISEKTDRLILKEYEYKVMEVDI